VLLTLPILDAQPATPRARLVRIDLAGRRFPFLAGQAVLIARRDHEPRQPYSIAASPEDAARDGWLELLVGLDEAGEPGSHLTLEAGSLVDLEGPIGRFTFPAHASEGACLFVAGGTGIAPLRAMLRHALPTNRRIGLLYSARTAREFAFEQEWRALAREGRIEFRQTITREAPSDWGGHRGRISISELAQLVHDPATLCFVCGPAALVEDVPRQLEELGVARERIRIEEWAAAAERLAAD
jgi:ferredoxin-NADP reductase